MRQVVILIPLLLTGCVHTQLKHNTIHQAGTLSNIYEQQVLDNLAKFVVDQHAVPDFAVASSGSAKVSDKGNVSAAKPLNPFFQTIGLGYDRSTEGSWALAPVTDPTRLKRMRCAYQRAIGCPDETCVKCCDLEKEWLAKKDTKIQVYDFEKEEAINDPSTNRPYDLTCADGSPVLINGAPTQYAIDTKCIDSKGFVTKVNYDCNECCAIHSGWFCFGSRCDVPRDCCELVGEHCGTYVWVPCQHRNELAKLVLAIMDYAVNDPATASSKKTKEVTIYSFEDGSAASKEDAAQVTVATVPIDLDPIKTRKLLGLSTKDIKLESESGDGPISFDPEIEQLNINPGKPPRPAARIPSPFDQRILFDVNAPSN